MLLAMEEVPRWFDLCLTATGVIGVLIAASR